MRSEAYGTEFDPLVAEAVACLSPHPPGDVLLLGAHSLGVDGRGGELDVAGLALHEVERDAGRDRGHPETVRHLFSEVSRFIDNRPTNPWSARDDDP